MMPKVPPPACQKMPRSFSIMRTAPRGCSTVSKKAAALFLSSVPKVT